MKRTDSEHTFAIVDFVSKSKVRLVLVQKRFHASALGGAPVLRLRDISVPGETLA